jgi:catechol 2,3-dioxygenase-like lactoylglutathione lyase family enzyme
MTIHAVDLGIVSADATLVDFYHQVLRATRLDPRALPMATIHRLTVGPVTLKIMVPIDPPAPAEPSEAFWHREGLRYFTVWVDDLDAMADRWAARGGIVTMAPFELRPGVRTAVLTDPDGNTMEAMQQD